jgi:hypothetical protein
MTVDGPVPFTPEEEAEWDKKEREWASSETLRAAGNVRERRNTLLTESDWTQVLDAAVDQSAWAAYRQSLRDIPQQEGFPSNVTWPDKP